MEKAECRQYDPELFYPQRGRSNDIAKAKFVCFVCPVKKECSDYADALDEHWGIWGGVNRGDS